MSEQTRKPAKPRNHTFDFLCGLCIIRMVLLHITESCNFQNETWWTNVMYWSYFFMSFFFFKAGYFNKTVSGNSRAYCKDKFKRLMTPYFVWGLVGDVIFFFFVWFILDERNATSRLVTLDHVWTTSAFFGNVPCWFLFSFFCAYIAMHFITKVRGLRWIVAVFPVVSWWLDTQGNPLWLSLNNVFFGIFLFFLGRLWHWLMDRMGQRTTISVSCLLIITFVYFNVFRHGEYVMSTNRWEGAPADIIVSTITSLCGISGLLLSVRMPRIPVINYIGQHSMVFFVAHMPMLVFYKLIRSANIRNLNHHWDDYILLILILFSICALLVPHVEKVPWLSGRFPKQPKPGVDASPQQAATVAQEPTATPRTE